MTLTENKTILFYDGECGVCHRFVQFMLDHKPKVPLYYAPLLGETGRQYFATPPDLSTVILIHQGKQYVRSEAVFRSLTLLGSGWKLFRFFLWVPAPLRDLGYRLFARIRHRIVTHHDVCRVPNPEERPFFLP